MVKVYPGLGSNIGNRELQLNEAVKILHDYQGTQITQISYIYETEPAGHTNRPGFLSLCVEIETELDPQSLLKCCLATEQQLHHKRETYWRPRTLDIDMLLLGDQITEQDNLSVPYPRMKERSLVLIPLNDIATKQIESVSNKSIGQPVVPDNSVKKYKE